MVSNEHELLDRVRSGDHVAFKELVSVHRGPVWGVCLRITGNQHDAEDALQDALAAAWQNIGSFRGDAKFSTWLFRIASNAALAIVRRRAPVSDAEVDGPSSQRDPGDSVADADRVQAALLSIPEAFRVALVLRVYGDFSYDDIAAHQGIPVQTVKSRLNRARTMVEDSLKATRD